MLTHPLNPETTRLQVLTEFFNPPQPDKRERTVYGSGGTVLTDDLLNFGAMRMAAGRAFSLGQTGLSRAVPVVKHWLKLEGRDFLIEEVEMVAIEAELEQLPQGASLQSGTNAVRLAKAGKPALPPQRQAAKKPGSKPIRMAQTTASNKGFVLDYSIINGDTGDYTFAAGQTYYISGDFGIYGTMRIDSSRTMCPQRGRASLCMTAKTVAAYSETTDGLAAHG